MQEIDITTGAAASPILETAATLYCAIQRLMEQEPGPQDQLFAVNNFQHIAAFGRARLAFHNAMAARPNVHTDMFVPPSGDIKQAGEALINAVTTLAIVSNGIASGNAGGIKVREYQQRLSQERSRYRHALEVFGTALGYPVYDPGALSYLRKESCDKKSPLYFD